MENWLATPNISIIVTVEYADVNPFNTPSICSWPRCDEQHKMQGLQNSNLNPVRTIQVFLPRTRKSFRLATSICLGSPGFQHNSFQLTKGKEG